jgi:hypothetical protein
MFGEPGVHLYRSYAQLGAAASAPGTAAAINTTATKLLATSLFPPTKINRGYACDGSFLTESSPLLGELSANYRPNYFKTQGGLVFSAQIDFMAAMSILANPNPAANDVNALTQGAIDAIGKTDRVTAVDGRGASQGRSIGLRAYDHLSRLETAAAQGDSAMALAEAQRIALNYASLATNDGSYGAGLTHTLVALIPLKSQDASFQAVIDDALAKLIASQDPDGSISVGGLDDQAIGIQAFLLSGKIQEAAKLISFLVHFQTSAGVWEIGGGEYPASTAKIANILSFVLTTASGKQALALLPSGL